MGGTAGALNVQPGSLNRSRIPVLLAAKQYYSAGLTGPARQLRNRHFKRAGTDAAIVSLRYPASSLVGYITNHIRKQMSSWDKRS
jgi:hypothetical protein